MAFKPKQIINIAQTHYHSHNHIQNVPIPLIKHLLPTIILCDSNEKDGDKKLR